MADMANSDQIDAAWERLSSATEEKIIPVTYINCSAELKAFVGKHEGSICKTLSSGIESSDPKLGQPHPTNMNFRSNPFGNNTDQGRARYFEAN